MDDNTPKDGRQSPAPASDSPTSQDESTVFVKRKPWTEIISHTEYQQPASFQPKADHEPAKYIRLLSELDAKSR